MPATHFLFIPAVLMVGFLVGWFLRGRAEKDAAASRMRREQARNKPRN